MLGALFDFFKIKKTSAKKACDINSPNKKKPLHVSRQIHYRTTKSNFFKNQTPDVSKVFENASKLPMMDNANLSFCVVGNGAAFVGFNRPKRVCGYGVFYPINKLDTNRSGLLKFAHEHNLDVYVLAMKGEQKCIQVRKHGKRYFLIDPALLRLRRKHYVATPKTEFLPRPGR